MSTATHLPAPGKFGRLAGKCIGICVFGGAFFGAFTWVLWMAVEEGDLSNLFALPLVMLAAIVPTALIVGTACGLIAALLPSLLAATAFVSNPMTVWCRVGAESGLLLSIVVVTLFIRIAENQNPLLWFLIFGVAGIGCGLLIGRSAWHEFRN
jgi:hypothetical protein